MFKLFKLFKFIAFSIHYTQSFSTLSNKFDRVAVGLIIFDEYCRAFSNAKFS